MNQEKVVDFKDLTDEEKDQYLEFLSQNNIVFENDDTQYVAKIKIKQQNQQTQQQKQSKQQQSKQLKEQQKKETQIKSKQQQFQQQSPQIQPKQIMQPQKILISNQNIQNISQPQYNSKFQKVVSPHKNNNQIKQDLQQKPKQKQLQLNPSNLDKKTQLIKEREELKLFQETEILLQRSANQTPKKMDNLKSPQNIRNQKPFQRSSVSQNVKRQAQRSKTPSPFKQQSQAVNKTQISNKNAIAYQKENEIQVQYKQQQNKVKVRSNSHNSINDGGTFQPIQPNQQQNLSQNNYQQQGESIGSIVSNRGQKLINKNIISGVVLLKIYQPFEKLMQFGELLRAGNKLSKIQIWKIIEEIYLNKFQKNTSQLKKNQKQDESLNQSFVYFTMQFFINKYKTQKLAEQNLINLFSSIEYYLNLNPEEPRLNIFKGFLIEKYQNDELSFFLFFFQMIEKTFSIKNLISFENYFLEENQIVQILEQVFGESEIQIFQQFFTELEKKDYQQNFNNTFKVEIQNLLAFSIEFFIQTKSFSDQNNSRDINNCQQTKIQNQNFSQLNDTNNSNVFQQYNTNKQSGLLDDKNKQEEYFQQLISNIYNPNDDLLFSKKNCQTKQTNNLQPQQNQQKNEFEKYIPPLKIPNNDQNQQKYQTKPIQQQTFNNENYQNISESFGNFDVQQIDKNQKIEKINPTRNIFQNSIENQLQQDQEEELKILSLNQKFSGSNLKLYEAKNQLETRILQKMEKKVQEFVQMMIIEYQENYDQEVVEKLQKFEKILKKKTINLIEAIFQDDLNKWYKLLLIHSPNFQQQNHLNSLVQIFSSLNQQFSNQTVIKNQEITNFCKKILKTQELSQAIGELLACITIKDDKMQLYKQ